MAGQFKPLQGLGSAEIGGLFSNLVAGDGLLKGLNTGKPGNVMLTGQAPKAGSNGEVVTGTNYLYHSLDMMASAIPQDLDLSLD